jgi:cytochrome c peroxidase
MMKRKILATAAVALLLSVSRMAMGEGPSAEWGKKLFNDPALGGSTNSASCSSCHPGGQGLAGSGDNPSLKNMINTCIEKALEGTRLEEESGELASLELYIQSLGK